MTMLRGVDISNHKMREGLEDLKPLMKSAQFCICKATGGVSFVDSSCDYYVQQLRKMGKPWGFYHFANDNGDRSTAEEEARFFVDNCENYFGEGIPILDWEQDGVTAAWANTFLRKVHDLSGVWPWVYSWPWQINGAGIEENCGRWIANYPNVSHPGLDYKLPDMPDTEGLVCAWQYASDGRVDGFSGDLDLNIFYGDVDAWNAYARGERESSENERKHVDVLENERYTVTIERK